MNQLNNPYVGNLAHADQLAQRDARIKELEAQRNNLAGDTHELSQKVMLLQSDSSKLREALIEIERISGESTTAWSIAHHALHRTRDDKCATL